MIEEEFSLPSLEEVEAAYAELDASDTLDEQLPSEPTKAPQNGIQDVSEGEYENIDDDVDLEEAFNEFFNSESSEEDDSEPEENELEDSPDYSNSKDSAVDEEEDDWDEIQRLTREMAEFSEQTNNDSEIDTDENDDEYYDASDYYDDEDEEETVDNGGFSYNDEPLDEEDEYYDDEESFEFEEEDPLEEELPVEVVPVLKKTAKTNEVEETKKKEDTKKPADEKTGDSLFERIKTRLIEIKEEVKSELHDTDDKPTKIPVSQKELTDKDFEEKETEEDKKKEKSEKKAAKKKNKQTGNQVRKIATKILSPYFFITKYVFQILETILKFISKIPLIGRVAKLLLGLTPYLKIFANVLPLLFFVALIYHVATSELNPSTTITLPDDGSVNFSNFSFDKDSKTFTGTLNNTGNVIANVTPIAEIYSSSIFNPISWFSPKLQNECVGKPINLGIGTIKEITITCANETSGIFVKSTGTLRSNN